MRYLFLFFIILFYINCYSPTFTNSTVDAVNSWNSTLSKTITVSGLSSTLGSGDIELTQFNLHAGR